jgi:hypothetical protein
MIGNCDSLLYVLPAAIAILAKPPAAIKKTVFLTKETTANPNTPNTQQFAVSVKGCGECEVRIEITEGNTKNVQSWASVSLSNLPGPTCTDSDMTGGEGTIGLVNEHDDDILRPTATATSGE